MTIQGDAADPEQTVCLYSALRLATSWNSSWFYPGTFPVKYLFSVSCRRRDAEDTGDALRGMAAGQQGLDKQEDRAERNFMKFSEDSD